MNIDELIQTDPTGKEFYVLAADNAHAVFTAATHYWGKQIVNVTAARWGHAGIPVKFEVTTMDQAGRAMTTGQSIPAGSHRLWIPVDALTFA